MNVDPTGQFSIPAIAAGLAISGILVRTGAQLFVSQFLRFRQTTEWTASLLAVSVGSSVVGGHLRLLAKSENGYEGEWDLFGFGANLGVLGRIDMLPDLVRRTDEISATISRGTIKSPPRMLSESVFAGTFVIWNSARSGTEGQIGYGEAKFGTTTGWDLSLAGVLIGVSTPRRGTFRKV
jgi:hypothetical protein